MNCQLMTFKHRAQAYILRIGWSRKTSLVEENNIKDENAHTKDVVGICAIQMAIIK